MRASGLGLTRKTGPCDILSDTQQASTLCTAVERCTLHTETLYISHYITSLLTSEPASVGGSNPVRQQDAIQIEFASRIEHVLSASAAAPSEAASEPHLLALLPLPQQPLLHASLPLQHLLPPMTELSFSHW